MTLVDPDCVRFAVAIAILVTGFDRLSVLLVEAQPEPWVLPEGMRRGGEGLDVAVARVVDEQAAIDLPDQVTQLWTYEDATPTPRGGMTVAFRTATFYPDAFSGWVFLPRSSQSERSARVSSGQSRRSGGQPVLRWSETNGRVPLAGFDPAYMSTPAEI